MRLLAIDPGLASTGLAVLDVAGPGWWTILYAETTRTAASLPTTNRLRHIRDSVGSMAHGCDYAVIESAHNQGAYGKRRGLGMNATHMATGCIVGAVLAFVDPGRIMLAPTSSWWPRVPGKGRVKVREQDFMRHTREWPKVREWRDKHDGISDHALTAVALGDWWTRRVENANELSTQRARH